MNVKNLGDRRLIAVGFVALLITLYFSTGFYHLDEHFQILEYLWFKLGLRGEAGLPWEYPAQMRPFFQVLVLYVWTKPLTLLGLENPFVLAFLIRLFHACVFVWALYQWAQSTKREYFAWYLVFFCVPFLAVRTSSESFSAALLFAGLAYYLRGRLLVSAVLMGLAFSARYQVGVGIAGFGLWMLFFAPKNIPRWLPVFLVTLVVGWLPDFWGYGEWVFSPWNYLRINVFEGKAASFGVNPWYDYFLWYLVRFPPVLGIVTVFLFWKLRSFGKHPMVWILVPFVGVHIMLEHKEFRFLFPLVFVFLFFAVQFLEWAKPRAPRLLKVALVINFFYLTILAFFPTRTEMYFFQGSYQMLTNQKVYALKNDPFTGGGLTLAVYKPKGLVVEKLQDAAQLPVQRPIWVSTDEEIPAVILASCEHRVSTLPKWAWGLWKPMNIRFLNLFYCR